MSDDLRCICPRCEGERLEAEHAALEALLRKITFPPGVIDGEEFSVCHSARLSDEDCAILRRVHGENDNG
jgi:hypothetical protein